MKDTINLAEARKTSPRLGVPSKNGKYLFSEWQRKYPDLNTGDYILPCSNAKLILVCANQEVKRKTADEYLEFAESQISEVITAITSKSGNRIKDNPKYLDSLFQLLREASFAKSRFGGDCRMAYTEEYRKEIHDRGNNYWQDNSKRIKS